MINPSDCVDMDCDGLKKVIITDTDGSYFGHQGTALSISEMFWDGDPRRGLGDYRIPTALTSDRQGNKVEMRGERGKYVVNKLSIMGKFIGFIWESKA